MHSLPSFVRLPRAARALFDAWLALPSVPCRHALGFAAEIKRRVNVNGETCERVASDLGFDKCSVVGVYRIFRHREKVSPERLACIAMLDWGLDDEDIGEIFGRSRRWAAVVRSQMDEIRADEPIPADLEYLDGGLRPEDPSPEEITRRCKEVRANGIPLARRRGNASSIRQCA